MSILVNLESADYPGTSYPLRYRVGGNDFSEQSYPVVAGATTRVYFNRHSR